MNKCVFCGSPVQKRNVTFSNEQNSNVLLISNVSAEVCLHCGEQMYSAETTDQILTISKDCKEPVQTIQVPLYDFSLQNEVT